MNTIVHVMLVGCLAVACQSQTEDDQGAQGASGGDASGPAAGAVAGASGGATECETPDLSGVGGAPAAEQLVSINLVESTRCDDTLSCPCTSFGLTLPRSFSVGSCDNNLHCGDAPVELTDEEVSEVVSLVTSSEFHLAQLDPCLCASISSPWETNWQVSLVLSSSSDRPGGLCLLPAAEGESHPTAKLRALFAALQEKYCE